jgi:hypothetical protein
VVPFLYLYEAWNWRCDVRSIALENGTLVAQEVCGAMPRFGLRNGTSTALEMPVLDVGLGADAFDGKLAGGCTPGSAQSREGRRP